MRAHVCVCGYEMHDGGGESSRVALPEVGVCGGYRVGHHARELHVRRKIFFFIPPCVYFVYWVVYIYAHNSSQSLVHVSRPSLSFCLTHFFLHSQTSRSTTTPKIRSLLKEPSSYTGRDLPFLHPFYPPHQLRCLSSLLLRYLLNCSAGCRAHAVNEPLRHRWSTRKEDLHHLRPALPRLRCEQVK